MRFKVRLISTVYGTVRFVRVLPVHKKQSAVHSASLVMPIANDDDFGAPRNGLGIRGHQIPHALSQTRLPTARCMDEIVKKNLFHDPVRKN